MSVSIISITYNHEKFIKDTIKGVLKQEVNFPVEHIIADDCSPDNTEEVVLELARNHSNGNWIKYTKHSKNKGMNQNFAWALSQCKGKYIAICEGDDYWIDPCKLQKQVDFLEANEEYVACYHGCKHVNADGEILKESRSTNHNDSPAEMLMTAETAMITHTVVFRNVIEKFPDFFYTSVNGDTILYHLLGFYGNGKFMRDIENSAYRVHEGGVWSGVSQLQHIKNNIYTLSEIKKNLAANNRFDLAKRVDRSIALRLNNFLFSLLLKKKFGLYCKGIWSILLSNFKASTVLGYHYKFIFGLIKRKYAKA